jgi:hypothetical protein
MKEKMERQRDDATRDRPLSYSQESRDKTTKQSKTECHKRDYKEEANIEIYSSHSLKFTLKSGIEKILQNRKNTNTHTTKTNQKNFFRNPADKNNFPSSPETTQKEKKKKSKEDEEEDEKPLILALSPVPPSRMLLMKPKILPLGTHSLLVIK